jgi:hypothetical protein
MTGTGDFTYVQAENMNRYNKRITREDLGF